MEKLEEKFGEGKSVLILFGGWKWGEWGRKECI